MESLGPALLQILNANDNRSHFDLQRHNLLKIELVAIIKQAWRHEQNQSLTL